MLAFHAHGYVIPAWGKLSKLTNCHNTPSLKELAKFMDVCLAVLETGVKAERVSIFFAMSLDSLLTVVRNPDSIAYSCDVKSSSSFSFTGAFFNPFVKYVCVYTYALVRTMLVYYSNERCPQQCVELPDSVSSKLVELKSQSACTYALKEAGI